MAPSPRDRFITVYGRKPVLEVLGDAALEIDKVVLAENLSGASARDIVDAAARRNVAVVRARADRVKLLAGNGRHDQGVLADVVAPGMRTVSEFLQTAAHQTPVDRHDVLLLDGITTPANVGMILRTATASGVAGVVVPHRGVASIDPLVVKASAGIALRAPVLRSRSSSEAAAELRAAGLSLIGLAAHAETDLFSAELPAAGVFVLGGESGGVSDAVATQVTSWISIPMAAGVESLNVASAAAVLCFELVRRRRLARPDPAAI